MAKRTLHLVWYDVEARDNVERVNHFVRLTEAEAEAVDELLKNLRRRMEDNLIVAHGVEDLEESATDLKRTLESISSEFPEFREILRKRWLPR